jgi:hypothetical protein
VLIGSQPWVWNTHGRDLDVTKTDRRDSSWPLGLDQFFGDEEESPSNVVGVLGLDNGHTHTPVMKGWVQAA